MFIVQHFEKEIHFEKETYFEKETHFEKEIHFEKGTHIKGNKHFIELKKKITAKFWWKKPYTLVSM